MSNKGNQKIINKEFNPLILSEILRRHWIAPILFISFFITAAFFYLRYTKPVYQSEGIIQIVEEDKVGEVFGAEAFGKRKEEDLSKYIELLKSELLLKKAVDNLDYDASVFSEGKLLTEDLYKNPFISIKVDSIIDSSFIETPIDVNVEKDKLVLSYKKGGKLKTFKTALNEKLQTKDFSLIIKADNINGIKRIIEKNRLYFVINDKAKLVKYLSKTLTVSPVDPEAKTIKIVCQHNNPILACDFSKSIMDVFFIYEEEISKKQNDQIISFVNNQLDSLSKELRDSKDKLAKFQKEANLMDPSEKSKDIFDRISKTEATKINKEEALLALFQFKLKTKDTLDRLEIFKLKPQIPDINLMSEITLFLDLLEQKEVQKSKITEQNAEAKILSKKVEFKYNKI